MQKTILMLAAVLLLSGCQAGKHTRAHYMDNKDFGRATRASLERQIANPDAAVAKIPQGIEGIDAEQMMSVHNKGYGKEEKKNNIFTIQLAK